MKRISSSHEYQNEAPYNVSTTTNHSCSPLRKTSSIRKGIDFKKQPENSWAWIIHSLAYPLIEDLGYTRRTGASCIILNTMERDLDV